MLRDEISVHVPSYKLRVARQAEEEVNVGVQADDLGGEQSHVPTEWGKQHIQKYILMASAKRFLPGTTLRKTKQKNPTSPSLYIWTSHLKRHFTITKRTQQMVLL